MSSVLEFNGRIKKLTTKKIEGPRSVKILFRNIKILKKIGTKNIINLYFNALNDNNRKKCEAKMDMGEEVGDMHLVIDSGKSTKRRYIWTLYKCIYYLN